MQTITVTVLNEHARRLLEELQALGALTIQSVSEPLRPEQRTFDALKIDTRDFKFNRDEANER